MSDLAQTIANLRAFANGRKFRTIYADPPWQFQNRTGKVAPEHKRLARYSTMPIDEIKALPVNELAEDKCHMYLWVPNALLPWGLELMSAWGFEYKTNIVWEKVRHDGQPDGRGVGFYFRNVTELLLFGVRGENNRTLAPGRSQVNLIRTVKREHSRKPDEIIPIIEACSPGPFLELFARGDRPGWAMWGNQATPDYEPTWATYSNHTTAKKRTNLDCVYPSAPDDPKQLLLAMETPKLTPWAAHLVESKSMPPEKSRLIPQSKTFPQRKRNTKGRSASSSTEPRDARKRSSPRKSRSTAQRH